MLTRFQFGRLVLTGGSVLVRDEHGRPIPGATVTATYSLPAIREALTNAAGIARFGKIDLVLVGDPPPRTLLVTNIVKTGFTFDPAQSMLS